MLLEEIISSVRKIDSDAADYLENEAPYLPSYFYNPYGYSELTLSGLMVWWQTPQGHSYWEEIESQLELEDFNDGSHECDSLGSSQGKTEMVND